MAFDHVASPTFDVTVGGRNAGVGTNWVVANRNTYIALAIAIGDASLLLRSGRGQCADIALVTSQACICLTLRSATAGRLRAARPGVVTFCTAGHEHPGKDQQRVYFCPHLHHLQWNYFSRSCRERLPFAAPLDALDLRLCYTQPLTGWM